MSLKRIKLPDVFQHKVFSDVRINGVWLGKGVVIKDGEYAIAPAVFQNKPTPDIRGICYSKGGFVYPLPEECLKEFEAVPTEQLPIHAVVEW